MIVKGRKIPQFFTMTGPVRAPVFYRLEAAFSLVSTIGAQGFAPPLFHENGIHYQVNIICVAGRRYHSGIADGPFSPATGY